MLNRVYKIKKLELVSFATLVDINSIFVPYMNTIKRIGQFTPFPEKIDLFREYNSPNNNRIYKDDHKNDNDDKAYNQNSKTGSPNEDNINYLLKGGRKFKLSFQNSSESKSQKLMKFIFK